MSPDFPTALGAAVNTALPPCPNWIRLTPYGEFPNSTGLQICDRLAADRMIKHFHSLTGRVGRLFRGLPIYVGHPDYPPAVDDYPDKTVYGHINALEARPDGLYGKSDWTDEGKSMVNEKDFLYPSPHWRMEPVPGRPEAFRPIRLVSVGLTNNPNIPGDPIPAQNALPLSPPTITATTSNMQLATFLELLSLPADATDDQITARLHQLKTDSAALPAANTRAASAEHSRNATLVTAAINEGRLTPADRPAWEQSLAADFPIASRDLAALRPALNTTARVAALGARRDEMGVDINGITAINEAVAREMKDSANPDRNKAWSIVKQKHPELFQSGLSVLL